jgi:chromosome segregation ATPase
MIRTTLLIGVILTNGLLLAPVCYSQNKAQDRKDEQRENERVKNAEKEVNEAKRDFAEIQKKLKEKLRSIDAREDSLSKTLRSYREAEDDAEQEIGASIGIPSALAKVKENRKKLDDASKPVLEQLHATPQWKELLQEVEIAKQKKEELNENAELDEAQRDAKMLELNRILTKPSEAETKAIQLSPDCIPLQSALSKSVDELESLRKKISREKVQSHPKVVQATKRVEEAKKELATHRRDLVTIRNNVSKAVGKVTTAQSELTKARVADAKDPNNGKPKSKGKGK